MDSQSTGQNQEPIMFIRTTLLIMGRYKNIEHTISKEMYMREMTRMILNGSLSSWNETTSQ